MAATWRLAIGRTRQIHRADPIQLQTGRCIGRFPRKRRHTGLGIRGSGSLARVWCADAFLTGED
jgi:hypothetical protein